MMDASASADLGNLAERVARGLATDIAAGRLPLGSRLPSETDLARTLGVSRAIVREAVSRLKQDGLVEARRGSGAYVRRATPPTFRLDRDDLERDMARLAQVFELRLTLEGDAAGYAAARRGDADLATLAAGLDAIAAAIDAGEDGIDADFAFHSAVARASGNGFALQLIDLIGTQMQTTIRVARAHSLTHEGRPNAVLAEHRDIFDAIVERRIDMARISARRHVMNAARRLGLTIGL